MKTHGAGLIEGSGGHDELVKGKLEQHAELNEGYTNGAKSTRVEIELDVLAFLLEIESESDAGLSPTTLPTLI